MTVEECIMSKDYEVFHASPWADLGQFRFQPNPHLGVDGKLFLGERLALTGAEVSLNRMPPGAAMPFFHRHQLNEELFIFVGGSGEMQIGDERFSVREGTVVRVATPAARIWRNTSDTDLTFICIQYREGATIGRDISDGERVTREVPW